MATSPRRPSPAQLRPRRKAQGVKLNPIDSINQEGIELSPALLRKAARGAAQANAGKVRSFTSAKKACDWIFRGEE